jgi:hypothetical protein
MNTGMQWRVVLCALALSLGAQAEVYKWVDENGKVQYGDQPPAGAKTQNFKPRPSGGFVAPASGDGGVKVQTAGGKVETQVDKEAAAKNCDIMTRNVQNAQEADTITVKDKDGGERQIGAQAKVDEIDKMRKERDRWCALAK